MAWHILHSLLEMVRAHSTFPGKLWIILMFVFRILVVARIGDNVYDDEQEQFFCNTRTPGCNNVCFNYFSPISQLRFWSFMVLIVSLPGIFFVIYATHRIYHASIKFPSNLQKTPDEARSQDSTGSYLHPPSIKRKRVDSCDPSSCPPYITPPTICIIRRRSDLPRRRKRSLRDQEGGMSGVWNISSMRHLRCSNFKSAPVSGGDFEKRERSEKISEEQEEKKMLENPTLFRAYWWHVVLRTSFEAGFLFLQYTLYGMKVPEVFVCLRHPCTQPTNCYISRPTEKTILLWIMFILGAISCCLSLAEFYALGWSRFRKSVCFGSTLSGDQQRILLARLNDNTDDVMYVPTNRGLRTDALSLDSASSDTTIESV